MAKATYKDSGVDLDVYEESMARLPRLMRRTHSPRVLPHDGGFAGLFQLDFAERAVRPELPRAGARLLHRRRRHEAEGRPARRPARHGRHRPGGDVRERRPLLRGRAAVFPRLRGDVARRSGAAGSDRPRHQRRLRRERHGPARRRDGDHARPLRPRRLRPGRLLRRRRREGARCSTARRSRRATWCSASPRAASTPTATAWCGRSCSTSPGSSVDDHVEAVRRDRRRRAAAADADLRPRRSAAC